jgi:dTDP-glucose 4,6-dehydratase
LYGAGTNVRDWLFVEDCCWAVELAAVRGAAGEAYNVGAGNEVRNIEVAERIVDLVGRPRDLIKLVADRPGHDRRYAVDSAKIRALGWQPAHRFEDALAATVRWYRENEAWWRKIKERSPEFRSWYDTYYKNRG